MSRAFVRESDADPGSLPEQPVSAHPNFVTPGGLALIEAQVREFEAQRQAARAGDDAALRAVSSATCATGARGAPARVLCRRRPRPIAYALACV